jgi:hypothetical protein
MACYTCKHSVRVTFAREARWVCSLYARETPPDYSCGSFSGVSCKDVVAERDSLSRRAPAGDGFEPHVFVGPEPADPGPSFQYALLIVNRVR